MARFKLFPRYRKPSMKRLFGVTKAKRRLKKASGFYALTKPARAPRNALRRAQRRTGYNSGPVKFWRWLWSR